MSICRRRIILAVILTLYTLLALGYGLVTPLFEAPDEPLHFYTADFMTRERRLPTTLAPGLMGQEAAQPPLYYMAAALLTGSIDNTNLAERLWNNARADIGGVRGESLATPPINANLFVHTTAEAWPWQGYALSAHLMRLLSTIIGLGTLLCIYGAARLLWPEDDGRTLLAVALVAFLPQFGFLHGIISNDTVIILFSTAALWQLLRLRLEPVTPGRVFLLGLTIGLAMLSKTAGLLLLGYTTVVLALLVWARSENRRWLHTGQAVALTLIPALLLAGWMLWRNWTLYGDVTAANQFVALAGGVREYTLRQVFHDLDRVWLSTFAYFGWMNVRPPSWVYVIWTGLVAAAAAGGLLALVRWQRMPAAQRNHDPRLNLKTDSRLLGVILHPAVILLGWFLLVAAAWLSFMLRTPADQGRLFFPALLPMALGVACGLGVWPRPWVQRAAVALALLTSVYSLLVVIPQAYERPPVVDQLPPEAVLIGQSFEEGLELLGATVDTAEAQPGDWVWATLYWRAMDGRGSGAPEVRLELIGRDFRSAGRTIAYHGRGNYPATEWPVGAIVADRLAVRLEDWANLPVQGHLNVKLAEEGPGVDFGEVKLVPATWLERSADPLAQFGPAIELALVDSPGTAVPDETIAVTLRWQIQDEPGPELLHAFVHLGDPTQVPLAQTDGPVMDGQYPSAVWRSGEVFEETVQLVIPSDLPAGRYPLNVGLYIFESGTRLPVKVNSERQPTDTYLAGWLIVE